MNRLSIVGYKHPSTRPSFNSVLPLWLFPTSHGQPGGFYDHRSAPGRAAPSHVYKGSSARRRLAFTSPLDRLQPKISFLRNILLPRSSRAHRAPRLRARVLDICWNRAILIPVPTLRPDQRRLCNSAVAPVRLFSCHLYASSIDTSPLHAAFLRESTYGWYRRYLCIARVPRTNPRVPIVVRSMRSIRLDASEISCSSYPLYNRPRTADR